MPKDDPVRKGLKALPTGWSTISIHKLAVSGLYYPVAGKENVSLRPGKRAVAQRAYGCSGFVALCLCV